jgi:hypothetical protein
VQGKKHTSANPLILSPFPLRTTNTEVKPPASDNDTNKLTNKYLLLADKALHTAEQESAHGSRACRTARLRVEPQDGSPAKDYRIQDGEVEVRIWVTGIHLADREWRRLTPEEIAYHVKNNTVVARWLEARLGWRRVLRKCVQAPEDENKAA